VVALTAVFQILAVVVAVGGVAKIVAPDAFSTTLAALGAPSGRLVARLCGAVEVVIGTGALLLGGRLAAAVLAVTYVTFALVVVAARRVGAVSCGCFGAASAPPSPLHVVVNATSGGLAALALVVGPEALADSLTAQPLAGVPYLAALALAAWLVIVLDTTGADLATSVAEVRALGPTFRDNSHGTAPSRTQHRHPRSPTPARTD
jgi:hypothetical protein